MNDVKDSLSAVERKKRRFKQQQFIFISALERSQDESHGRNEPVKTVLQVQRYMTHHCSNATDRGIFSFFLEIVSDLNNVLRLINASCRNPCSDALITCKMLLHADSDISKLHAQHPHDEVMRLSCQTKAYYGGIVSIIPLALDYLRAACATPQGTPNPTPPPSPIRITVPTPTPTRVERPTHPRPASSHGVSQKALVERRPQSAQPKRNKKPTSCRGALLRHAIIRPAWKPPGSIRM